MSIFKRSNEGMKKETTKNGSAEKWPSVDEILGNNKDKENTSSEVSRGNSKTRPKNKST